MSIITLVDRLVNTLVNICGPFALGCGTMSLGRVEVGFVCMIDVRFELIMLDFFKSKVVIVTLTERN